MNPKIKWVKNSRVKKHPKICSSNIVDKESDAESSDIVVSMTNVSKKYPTINVRFPRKPERKQMREKNSSGQWITKSWTDSPSVIASINTEEGYIHFNRAKIKHSELRNLLDVVDTVCEFGSRDIMVETI
jgi:hypothetical protein|tara:strand:- start:245 stop:634 length:390 start_codon:yes stop_codon:yes gene_type:complete